MRSCRELEEKMRVESSSHRTLGKKANKCKRGTSTLHLLFYELFVCVGTFLPVLFYLMKTGMTFKICVLEMFPEAA